MKIHEGIVIRNSKKGKAYKQLMNLLEKYTELLYEVNQLINENKLKPRDLAECYSSVLIYKLPKIKVGTSSYDSVSREDLVNMIKIAKKDIKKTERKIEIAKYSIK